METQYFLLSRMQKKASFMFKAAQLQITSSDFKGEEASRNRSQSASLW